MRFGLIVLAAGKSRRFGAANKLLEPFDGEALVVRTVRRALGVRVAGHTIDVRVVADSADGAVARAIRAGGLGQEAAIVVNQRADEGIGTSVAAGIASLDRDMDAAVILPGDMPFVSAEAVSQLIEAFAGDGGLRPAYLALADGTQVNPVIWPRGYFAKLAALEGDRGGKGLLAGQECCTILLGDLRHAADIDTPEDLARLQTGGKSAR